MIRILLALALVAAGSIAARADSTVNALPAATTPYGATDQIYCVQGGVDKKCVVGGLVTGPASSTSDNVPTFNGTTGAVLKDGGKALPAGAIVGTTDTQTLTNKAIDASEITTGTLAVARGGTGSGTAFTQGSALFAGAAGVYSQDNANFFWDATNHRLGIGTASPQFQFMQSANAATPAKLPAAANMYGVGVDGAGFRFILDDYASGGAGSQVNGRSAEGTAASPTATQSGTPLLFLSGTGYGATGFNAIASSIEFDSTQIFTDSAGGSNIKFAATKNGTVTRSVVQIIDGLGHVFSQNPSATQPSVSACGTGSPAIRAASSDAAGEVTEGTSAAGCTITFANAYGATPVCVVTSQTQLTAFAYTISTSAITITNTSTSGDKIDWICNGQ